MVDRPQVTDAHMEGFVQEALLKILDGLDTFRGESRFLTWAQKIAVHEAFTELRRKRWENVSLQDFAAQYEGDFIPTVLTDHEPSPEQRVTQQMLLKTVHRFIAEELTEKQRHAMLAVMVGGMPLQEVAHQMGITRNALYKRLHDARQRLQKRMLEEGLSLDDVLGAFKT
jgi:RNA polymerase sigma-70 factor (ECF subfamily)